jgi:hypothetical protein
MLEGYFFDGKEYAFEKAPDCWVRINASTWKEDAERDILLSKGQWEVRKDGSRSRKGDYAQTELIEKELQLTFGGSNIVLPGETDPLFKDDMSSDKFSQALSRLPSQMVLEWWDAVRDVNKGWDPKWSEEEKNSETS